MPSTTFSTDNVKSNQANFPRIKMREQNEVIRLVCAEPGPHFEWVHTLRKPTFKANGEPKMIHGERRDGTPFTDYDKDFVGVPICFGDKDILEDKGVDPDNCPACAKAMEQRDHFSQPERKFAINVLKYKTNPGTATVVEPFNVDTLVWTLPENRFAKVSQAITEWGGDPREIDLILGPCTNTKYQNYEIHAGQRCEMRADSSREERAKLTYQESHATDLSVFCGRRVEKRWLERDIEEIEDAWAQVEAGGAEPQTPDVSQTLDGSLIDTAPAQSSSPRSAPKAQPPGDDGPGSEIKGLDEFAAATTSNPHPQPLPEQSPADVADAPAEQPAQPAPSSDQGQSQSNGSDESFEDLLKSLGN